MLQHDVQERTNSSDAIFWQRYNMTYRKEQNRVTLYPDKVTIWRTGKSKIDWRCIPTTVYYYVQESKNSIDAVMRQLYTMAYRKA